MILRAPVGILGEIVFHKQFEVKDLLGRSDGLEQRAADRKSDRRNFLASLLSHQPAIISEVKKASPSKGLLQPDFDPAAIARQYEQGGAACLSVLTDARYFQGKLDDLSSARAATQLPALRKDFTIHPVQIYEAAAHGADAVLLIAAVLEPSELRQLREIALSLDMAALVEVHDEEDLRRAIDSGAGIIGVNNRNLETFEVSLETSLRLSEKMPSDVVRVSESGISTRADVDVLCGAGFHAFLVGECLMRSPDPSASLRALLG